MRNLTCVWEDMLDEDYESSLKIGYFVTGLLCAVLGLWFNMALEMTDLWDDQSYNNFSNFTRAAMVRRLAAGFGPLIVHIGSPCDAKHYCNILTYVESFLSMLETEWLAHISVERYILAKYAQNGLPMQSRHYSLFKGLSMFLAALYTTLPKLGFGGYVWNFSCNSCTVDIVAGPGQAYAAVAIYFMRYIKPALVMLTMLTWAYLLEQNIKKAKDSYERQRFTRNMIIVTFANLFCWAPIIVIRGGVVITQVLYTSPVILTSLEFVKWALWLEWASAAVNAVMMFIVDIKIRNKMLMIPDSAEDQSKVNDNKNK